MYQPTEREIQQRLTQAFVKKPNENVEQYAAKMTLSNTLLKATDRQKSENELADIFIATMKKEGPEYRAAFVSFIGNFQQAISRAKEVESNMEYYTEEEEDKPRKNKRPAQPISPAATMKSTIQSIATIGKAKDDTLARMEALEQKTAGYLAAIQAAAQQGQPNQLSYAPQPQSQQTTQFNNGNAKKGDCGYCGALGHFEIGCRKKKWDSSQSLLGKQATKQWIDKWCGRYAYYKSQQAKENNGEQAAEPPSDILKQNLLQFQSKNPKGGERLETQGE